MFRLVIAAAMLMSSLSVAFAIQGGRSTAFYNNHSYTINPGAVVADVVGCTGPTAPPPSPGGP
jgi:hypothetical protein